MRFTQIHQNLNWWLNGTESISIVFTATGRHFSLQKYYWCNFLPSWYIPLNNPRLCKTVYQLLGYLGFLLLYKSSSYFLNSQAPMKQLEVYIMGSWVKIFSCLRTGIKYNFYAQRLWPVKSTGNFRHREILNILTANI